MTCNLKMFEAIIGLIVVVFSLWQTTYSQWIAVLAGAVILLHGLFCKHK